MKKRFKVLVVFGTRPEAIKLAPVVQELARQRRHCGSRICVTAQHRHMLDQVLRLFSLKAHHDLDIMRKGQSLEDVTTRVLEGLSGVLQKERPEMVVVQGDTTTAFVAALASYYARVPVAHVEAGLRTWEKYSPFPEEINRVLVSRIADLHFAPTSGARDNLLREGIDRSAIHVTGNTVIDALFHVRDGLKREPRLADKLFPSIDFSKRVILVTGHRRENFGEGFRNICLALRDIAKREPDVQIVYPVHLNPNVRKPVYRTLEGLSNITLLEPLDYRPFVALMDRSFIILTDSGGVQEEAPSLGKPVLVMRKHTERPEAVKAGTVRLVGTDRARIVHEVERLLHDRRAYRKMALAHNPYGDGKSSARIVKAMRAYFQ